MISSQLNGMPKRAAELKRWYISHQDEANFVQVPGSAKQTPPVHFGQGEHTTGVKVSDCFCPVQYMLRLAPHQHAVRPVRTLCSPGR